MFCDTATRDLVQDQIVTRKQHFYFIRNNDYSEASLYIKKSNTCVCVRYLSLNRSDITDLVFFLCSCLYLDQVPFEPLHNVLWTKSTPQAGG